MIYVDVYYYNEEYNVLEDELPEGAILYEHIPEPCQFDLAQNDFVKGVFNLDKWTERTGRNGVKILLLKEQLQKYKEDVEQVELFGMERSDYEEKKQTCANIILQLRELERK